MDDERAPGAPPRTDAFRDINLAADVSTFAGAVREGSGGIRDLGIEYARLGPAQRAAYVIRVDRFVAAIGRTWAMLKTRIEAPTE